MAELFAGRYAIDRQIGQGATATVHRARDTQGGTTVAIKLLREELAESATARRFLREIRQTSALTHPHIVPVLDAGEVEGHPYFVLPYMEGGTLRHRMRRERQLGFEAAAEILQPIAEALDYAHARGLVHRDVKPENILFTEGRACLGDFGIARALQNVYGDTTTSANVIRGTPAYMSPEQASGSEKLDGRSDQFALACVYYEMVTGMQAYQGPTAESTIAMRFSHPPRELRVYRPGAPQGMQSVLSKAFAVQAADRFESATAFVDALRQAIHSPPADERPPRWRRASTLLTGAALAATAALLAWGTGARMSERALARLDTTRLLVLPVEGDTALQLPQIQQLLYDGVARWRGIQPVMAPVSTSPARPAGLARKLGVGRYLVASATRVGGDVRLAGAIHDVRSDARLIEFADRVPARNALSDSIVHRMVDTLLIRRADVGDARPGTLDLAALQAFASGYHQLRAWNLEAADSMLNAAAARDRGFGRAALWAAQVRVWRDWPAERWRVLVERAQSDSGLSQRERLLSGALLALADRNFESSCRDFERMRRMNDRDFVAWYGLGDCRRKDSAVLPDRRSRSGWRFRASYNDALRAYVRAFELSPNVHLAFQPRGFNRLQDLLFVSGSTLRAGRSVDSGRRDFYAMPESSADTLAFVPYPADVVAAGLAPHDAAAVSRRVVRQKQLFRQIAAGWSTALPGSAAAKHAVAISLEMLGDSAAIDTIAAARRLADDPAYRLELAVVETLLRFEFARGSPEALATVRRMSDSILTAANGPEPVDETVAPLAALRGRCARAAHARSAGDALPASSAPEHLKDAAVELTLRAALGCAPDYAGAAAALVTSLRRDKPSLGTREMADEEAALLSRAVSLIEPMDSARLVRLDSTADYLWRAQRALVRGERAEVRAILDRMERRRGPVRALEVSPDALLAESRLWVALGDTARARAWLDPVLNHAGWLDALVGQPVYVAALVQCMALRAAIAAPDEVDIRRRWKAYVQAAWGDAEPGPREIAQRLTSGAR